MKHILKTSVFLLLGLLLPGTADAYDFEVDGIYYNILTDNTVEVTYFYDEYGNSYSDDVSIPSTITYNGRLYFVTSIGAFAFRSCSGLTSVDIPNSVTSIGEFAFNSCSGLTNVTIPNSVTSIGPSAFSFCSGLISVTIPNSVTSIDEWAFEYCSGLTSVTIGNSVTTIGYQAFYDCNGISNLTWNARNCSYNGDMTTSNIEQVIIGNEVEVLPSYFVSNSEIISVTIPNSVTFIGNNAFRDCWALAIIDIPNSVTSIGESAFEGTPWYYNQPDGLVYAGKVAYKYKGTMPAETSIILADGTLGIAACAFYGCSGLTSIDIPNSVTSIGGGAFESCSGLTSVTIGNSVTTIGNQAFYGCSGLTSIDIPNSVTSIGGGAFKSCLALKTLNFNAINCADLYQPFDNLNITTINIGDNVKRIPAYFASGLTKLTSITIPNSVTSIGNNAFYGCSGMTSVTIGNSVTSIGNNGFYGCSGMTSIDIPNSVTSIGGKAFYGCNGLTSVTIGNSVTTINDNAFSGCSGLTRVDISDLAAWCRINFGSATTNPLYYAKHLYLNGNEENDLVIPEGVDAIGDYAFYNCSLSSVKLNQSLTSVGMQAFNNSPSIETVTCMATTPPTWDGLDLFTTNVYNHTPLVVPNGCARAYMRDQCWGQFAKIVCPGDVNMDGTVTISDVTTLINSLLRGSDISPTADINFDGKVTISDVTTLINYLLTR